MDDGLVIIQQTVLHIIQTIDVLGCRVNLGDKEEGRPRGDEEAVSRGQSGSAARSTYLVLDGQEGLLQQACGGLPAPVELHNCFVHCNLVVVFAELLQGLEVPAGLVVPRSLQRRSNRICSQSSNQPVTQDRRSLQPGSCFCSTFFNEGPHSKCSA